MRFSLFFLSLFVLSLSLFSFVSCSPRRVAPFGHQSDWTPIPNAALTDSQAALMHDTAEFPLLFLLRTQNAAEVESLLTSVSDPSSPHYGRHLSLPQIRELSFPGEHQIQLVQKWLHTHGAKDISVTQSGDFISATLSLRSIRHLFDAEVQLFQHRQDHHAMIRRSRSEYRIPMELDSAIEAIVNLNAFPNHKPRAILPEHANTNVNGRIARQLLQSSGSVTPSVINQAYGIDTNIVAHPSATQAVFERGQYFDTSDLVSYFQEFNIQYNFSTHGGRIIGPNNPGACDGGDPNQNCMESLLDLEVIMSVAQLSRTDFYSANTLDITPFADYMRFLLNETDAPLVVSISYGEYEYLLPKFITSAFSLVVAKVGLRGVTVLVASGDEGVAGQGLNGFTCAYIPGYPATSPYVVAVGATMGPESGQPEHVCSGFNGSIITSGGGFSNAYAQPAYQRSVVQAYLANPLVTSTSQKGYNTSGRGFPDVAALGNSFVVIDGGQSFQVSGTSASTPLFAGVITLINGLRLAAGKSPVGFANPALYQIAASTPDAFHDITEGRNNAGEEGETCPGLGFPATKGWDATTGLGSPNFPKLKAAFMALP